MHVPRDKAFINTYIHTYIYIHKYMLFLPPGMIERGKNTKYMEKRTQLVLVLYCTVEAK